jgi:hypothetical protein
LFFHVVYLCQFCFPFFGSSFLDTRPHFPFVGLFCTHDAFLDFCSSRPSVLSIIQRIRP